MASTRNKFSKVGCVGPNAVGVIALDYACRHQEGSGQWVAIPEKVQLFRAITAYDATESILALLGVKYLSVVQPPKP